MRFDRWSSTAVGGIEMLGYGFQGLATLFVAPIFTGGKLARWIRWLLIVDGIMGVAGTVITGFALDWVFTIPGLLSYVSWNVEFALLTILLSVFFYRTKRQSV